MVDILDIKMLLGDYAYLADNRLAAAIVIIISSFVVASIAVYIMKRFFTHIAKRTRTELDDKILEALPEPTFRIIVLLGVMLAMQVLEIGALGSLGANIIMTLIYLVAVGAMLSVSNAFFVYGLSRLAEKTESTFDDEILPIAKKTASAVIWIFGIIVILGQWGIEIGPFLAGLGIAGLAISFAVQDSLSNIFGGISLILDKVFKVGDKVKLESGEVGTIADVGLRSTRLRTYDNEIIIIPNSKLANGKIKNYVQPDHSLRVVVKFGVEYGTDPEKVKKIISKALKKMKDISKTPEPDVVFTEMADFALLMEARVWVPRYTLAYDKWLEATGIIYEELGKAKIGIPFPTTTVHLKK